ncbi:MAG: nascent polypeptide-associated complex protein [Nitrososphaerales archaeon]
MMRGNRQLRRMLDKMGLNMHELNNVEEVVIKTNEREIIIRNPTVAELKSQDSTIYQVVGDDIQEKQREVPKFSEEDIMLVSQQANVSKEVAIEALTESKGDLAKAILTLTTK